jgi:hypothetical protein
MAAEVLRLSRADARHKVNSGSRNMKPQGQTTEENGRTVSSTGKVSAIVLLLAAVVAGASSRLAADGPEQVQAVDRSPTQPGHSILDDLKPGEWFEAPDSHLESVAAPVSKFPWLRGSSGIAGVIACWCGGAFDSQRDRLYLGPGGGHAGYNGNEVYAFDLNDLKWRRLNDPDPVIPGTEYTDLNKAPFAMHTYDGLNYLPPPVDRYVVVGGWNTPRTYALNPDQPSHWEAYPDHGTGRTGDISAVDPVSGLLWLSTPITSGKLSQWDPSTHEWTLRTSSSPDPTYYETADIDTKRGLLVSCGHGKVKTWRLKPIPAAIEYQEIHTTGDTDIVQSNSPGFCYVPLIDKFVAWFKGPEVYSLDIDKKLWTKHSPAATNAVTPGPADQWGTFGRFRYVASKNVFVVCNSVKQNVFVYRLTADRPNVITGVAATLVNKQVETNIPVAAIRVDAIYADGTRRNVTDQAWYVTRDPAIARVASRGRGVIEGIAPGLARIRVTYSDPAFRRGFSDEVTVNVKEIVGDATLDSVEAKFHKLTISVGESFRLEATGSYVRGKDRFARPCTEGLTWTSSAPDIASVSGGVIKAVRQGGPVTITCAYQGKTDTAQITISEAPVIQRIHFQVTDSPPRSGWLADNGQRYSDARGFGWLSLNGMSLRDDRNSAQNALLRSFVSGAQENQFKVKVPKGPYLVRIAMGDADYGANPFEAWAACGTDTLVYYQGHANNSATKIVQATDDGLVFTVKGPINYLILAPVGVDLNKFADDGAGESSK